MGIMHFWNQADWVSHGVAVLLVLLSLFSWIVIIERFFRQLRQNRSLGQAFDAFWAAGNLREAVTAMRGKDPSGLFAGMAEVANQAAEQHQNSSGIGAGVTRSEAITRALRNHITHSQASLESGLTALASIGSTAPFIGLFGTVWGIYHALVGLSGATQVVLGRVAGPVGEALIMTAAGLFVAIPAVLAYNALTRANRLTLAYLDGFAHDLHTYLTTGGRAVVRPAD
ncbi:MotA/TolQ/ExbB proton channel family protein [Parasulfuritortus cantonensis]|uniref:Biopolymer transport protein ExbB n=1 Tax=Parasulfuritortus cantonensis TaxID=2528202 RepID=A0A4R1BDG6_9PROT|nr:MotA/TolQ/ExbB proton channel family protein [Parasulfuritortus cantonensis]TCJ15103.1 MotA/TolQ/ExbB proton channel family protein [Parasulfuritortus cantonensis]